MSEEYVDFLELCYLESRLKVDDTVVSRCKITFSNQLWCISEWYTSSAQQNQGYGTKIIKHTLQKLYDSFGYPNEIRYIWNGANEYVMDWLKKHFEPMSKEPIAVQKYASEDDWSSHIYILNKDKVLKFFEIT